MARRPGRPRASADPATGRGTAAGPARRGRRPLLHGGLHVHEHLRDRRAGRGAAGVDVPPLRRQARDPARAAARHRPARRWRTPTGCSPWTRRPAARLWALCHADVGLLCAGRDNLGALYLLPELADERFAEFRSCTLALRARYAELVGARAGRRVPTTPAALAGLAFGLVESVILRRRDEPDLAAADVAPRVADAVQRVLGVRRRPGSSVRAGGSAAAARRSLGTLPSDPPTLRRRASPAGQS